MSLIFNDFPNAIASLILLIHYQKSLIISKRLFIHRRLTIRVHLNDKRDLSGKDHKSAVVVAPENVKSILSLLDFSPSTLPVVK